MPLKRLTLITLLAALCVVLRQAFAFLPNIQPISAIFFLLVLFEDWAFACLVMAVTMFTSAFLLGNKKAPTGKPIRAYLKIKLLMFIR